MAEIMKIGLVTEDTTPQVAEYTIKLGWVETAHYEGRSVRKIYSHIADATDISTIFDISTSGTFDCYIDAVIDEEHKLAFKFFVNSGELAIYSPDSTMFVTGVFERYVQSSSIPTYILLNDLLYQYLQQDYSALHLDTIEKWEHYNEFIYYMGIDTTKNLYSQGMNLSPNSIFNIMENSSTDWLTPTATGQDLYATTMPFNDLATAENWYKFLTGKYMIEAPYLETNVGDRIYLSVSVGESITDYLINDNSNNTLFPFLNEHNPNKVNARYQSGTDLMKLLPLPNDELTLKNGVKIKFVHKTIGSNNHYYYYEVTGADGETVYNMLGSISYYSNYRSSSGWQNSTLTNTTLPDDSIFTIYGIGGLKRYETTESSTTNTAGKRGHYSGILGVTLWKNDTEDNLKTYVNTHKTETAAWWNQTNNLPYSLAMIVKDSWTLSSKDGEGNTTDPTTRETAYGFKFSRSGATIEQSLIIAGSTGYKTNRQSQNVLQSSTLTTTFTSTETSSLYLINGAGELNVDDYTGAMILIGALGSSYPATEPSHGENSTGGGIGAKQSQGETLGGDGEFDDSSDDVTNPLLPATVSTGLTQLWFLGEAGSASANDKMNDLRLFLNDTSILSSFEDRVQGVISLKNLYSWSQPSIKTPSQEIGDPITIRNKTKENQLVGYEISSIYQSQWLANFHVDEYFGSFLDYAPYTSIKIYLPFSGTYDLDPSLIVGGNCNLYGKINLINGDILYTISIEKDNMNSVIYSFNGNVASEIPITSSDYSQKVSSFINTGLSAAAAISAIKSGNTGIAISQGASAIKSGMEWAQNQGDYKTTGMTGGSIGQFGVKFPYLIITRPKQVIANEYGSINGYPSMASIKIGELTGYAKVYKCNWSIPGATSEELEELDRLTKTEGILL